MNINFAPVDERFIKSMVEKGYYCNATDVVRDAVRRLREEQTPEYKQLLEALRKGEEDFAAGRVVPYTPSFLDECEARAEAAFVAGERPSKDVMP